MSQRHACASLQWRIAPRFADELLNSTGRHRPGMATTPDSSSDEQHPYASIEEPTLNSSLSLFGDGYGFTTPYGPGMVISPDSSSEERQASTPIEESTLYSPPGSSSGDRYINTYRRGVASPTPEETGEEQDASTRNESPDQQEFQDSSFDESSAPPGSDRFPCDYQDPISGRKCKKSYSSPSNLIRHFKKEHPAGERHFTITSEAESGLTCDYRDPISGRKCRKSYNTSSDLTRHFKKKHKTRESHSTTASEVESGNSNSQSIL